MAIASRNRASAEQVAQSRGIGKVHDSVRDLLQDESIEVVDLAVPPDCQPDLILEAVELGRGRLRGILAQKPLALTVATGRQLVQACAEANIRLGVNQNMRYDQAVRATRQLLHRGDLGEPIFASIDMRAVPHWMPWSARLPSLSTFVMSIHHLDTFRFWLGTPNRVMASTRPDPRTAFPHRDGLNLYILEYDAGPRASAWDDVWAGPNREVAAVDHRIQFRVEGSEGVARGSIGWPKYPAREPSTLDWSSARFPGYWMQPRWNEVWFPDAFVGTMAQLLCAIEDDREPEISGQDNLETLALCEAVFRAATQRRVVELTETLGN